MMMQMGAIIAVKAIIKIMLVSVAWNAFSNVDLDAQSSVALLSQWVFAVFGLLVKIG
jgi:hypothetical protein